MKRVLVSKEAVEAVGRDLVNKSVNVKTFDGVLKSLLASSKYLQLPRTTAQCCISHIVRPSRVLLVFSLFVQQVLVIFHKSFKLRAWD